MAMAFPSALAGTALGISLVSSALGFKRAVYFVSLGYALSIAGQALAFAMIYWTSCSGWPLLQVTLLLVYGIRLGTFVILRDLNAAYRKTLADTDARTAKISGIVRVGIWGGVGLLYALMFLPALLTLSAQAKGLALGSVSLGVVVMAVGLGVEACVDWQKSRFKARHPDRFCSVALFRVARYPNYLGEMIFWTGVWISGISANQNPLAWVLSTLGFLCIECVMIDATRRLELKQMQHYGADPAYQRYVWTVPVLFPVLPVYTLRSASAPVP